MTRLSPWFASAIGTTLLALLLGAGVGPAADNTAEVNKFQGTWYSVSTELDGEQKTGITKDEQHIFSGNKWTRKVKDQVVSEATFTVKELKPYWVITLKYTVPEKKKDAHWLAIYRFDGDTLQWIGDNVALLNEVKEEDYKKLPKAFETKKGDGNFMRTLRRLSDK